MQRGNRMHSGLESVEGRRRQELEVRYDSDTALGARYHEHENLTLLPGGSVAAKCTNYARFIRSLEPNTAVWGFSGDANPESTIGQSLFGHDFAVVDSRYIVDPWVVERAGMSERAVFDLEDPRDAEEIRHLYGDCSTWKLMYPLSGR
jgi:hypothetical protein